MSTRPTPARPSASEPGAGLTIRRIRREEYAAVGEITVSAYAEFTSGSDDPYLVRLRDVDDRDRAAEVWVALREDRLLGSVTVAPPGSAWREVSTPDEGEFRMLAVDPTARGSGAGGALLEFVLDRFRTEGMAGVAISSLAVMTAAHRLYARAGFERDPSRDWSPHEGVDLLAFALRF